jgi:aminocarboxymuconate-semialdehyde decarboxylase
MCCTTATDAALMIGEKSFRALDDRSWSVQRRLDDMDRDGVSIQVLSPMPELLSYWMDASHAEPVCDTSNDQIARMISAAPRRFRGLGSVPLQDPQRAASMLSGMRTRFGLSGVEIGSNINGIMIGDRRFDPFYAAAEEAQMSIFVHALHPVAARPIAPSPAYTTFALFPIDVAMAASSLILEGTLERFPRLKIGFSHGGGALSAILGRLDRGWESTGGYGLNGLRPPSEIAKEMFFDSNVYDTSYLRHLATVVSPGRVFLGTDYPYKIMQEDPSDFIAMAGLDPATLADVRHGAAESFLGEKLI